MPRLYAPLPLRVHAHHHVPTDTAQAYLDAYLAHCDARPHMHPDAYLGPHAVFYGPHGPAGGILLHLLRRIERGLAGQFLEPDPEELWDEAQEAIQNSQTDADDPMKDAIDPDLYALAQEDAHTRVQEKSSHVAPNGQTIIEVWDPDEPRTQDTSAWGAEFPGSEFADITKAKDRQKEKSKIRKEAKKARRKEAKMERARGMVESNG